MPIRYDTKDVAPAERSRRWHDVIAATYFPLNLSFRAPATFNGELAVWRLGELSLSRLTSDALTYERRPHHLANERDEQYLVTAPAVSDVTFKQCGIEQRCRPGGFILERGHEPYEFGHPEANDLWVLKVPGDALRGRIRSPDRFSTLQFDATAGVGALFVDMLHLIPGRFETMSKEAHTSVGQQLVDLLVLALKSDHRVLASSSSSVREAHLARIEAFVRSNLTDPSLDPERIAAACGISVRYLHGLFRGTDQTVANWIRDQRLLAARDAIRDPFNNETIAETAYRLGLSGQAKFSRLLRSRF